MMSSLPRSTVKMLLNILAACIATSIQAGAQTMFIPGQTYFGTNNYIEYTAGNVPIIITASHGGDMSPSEIPTRNCPQCVTTADAATQELVRTVGGSFQRIFGCSPHIIINRLHRRNLDANREIVEAAQGNLQAERAWNEFHLFIDSAKQAVIRSFGRGLYLDVHGHGHSIQRLELGYLLRDNELNLPDDTLNTVRYVGFSSIRSLVGTNTQGIRHAQLLRGDGALGTLLGQRGYPSVPSKQDPFPRIGDDYFDGGYNTARHSSYRGGTIDGLQIECNFVGVRDSPAAIRRFADSLAVAVQEFLRLHYAFPVPNSCLTTSVVENYTNTSSVDKELTIFPQPSANEIHLRLPPEWKTGFVVSVFDMLGNVVVYRVQEFSNFSQDYILATDALPSGVYAVLLQQRFGQAGAQYIGSKTLRAMMIIAH
ncbi:MAG: T9SS type A sorting domain-containing protein [Candidatus Kapabacteria bacterium]|nr:T9SS type A sorting domain-containing protein [Candidatus Kapabacteria bacterium]